MRRGSSVGVILLLALGLVARESHAQSTGAGPPDARDQGTRLEQNFPNPFNPETTIPFTLGEELFQDGKPVQVTIRISNVLGVFVASPVALNHPERPGARVERLTYTAPGSYEAHWDGRYQSTGHEVASGVYHVEFIVHDRFRAMKRMTVAK